MTAPATISTTDEPIVFPLVVLTMPDNGCELSGRGSRPHRAFQQPVSPLSLASAAASPVRSSELLRGHLYSPRYKTGEKSTL